MHVIILAEIPIGFSCLWLDHSDDDAVICSMHKHARLGRSRGMLPQEIRCSEIASEVIFEQKQSRSSYIAHGVLHPIFGCPCMHC